MTTIDTAPTPEPVSTTPDPAPVPFTPPGDTADAAAVPDVPVEGRPQEPLNAPQGLPAAPQPDFAHTAGSPSYPIPPVPPAPQGGATGPSAPRGPDVFTVERRFAERFDWDDTADFESRKAFLTSLPPDTRKTLLRRGSLGDDFNRLIRQSLSPDERIAMLEEQIFRNG